MKLVSVSVGLPREVIWKGRTVRTGILKEPLSGRVMLRRLNLDGDRQADLTVHGGPDKAVYLYPVEHYEYWRGELPAMDLPFGMFGENFTTDGLWETGVSIGDRIRVGGAEIVATQPRLPCYKGVKFQSDDMVKRFLESGRTGFYGAVLREGEVGPGDSIEVTARDERQVPVPEITRLYITKRYNRADLETVRRATEVPALPESWRNYFRTRLENAQLRLP
ncbi:MAG TPA: MOSC domain-containing protein [Candidatus Acidoferrales bacterium]|nr:MOSC domain-containing protein [Candidatus Acidoferrales bacterium]